MLIFVTTKFVTRMRGYPKAFVKFMPVFVYALVLPAFYLLSILWYEPTRMHEMLCAGGEHLFTLNISITAAIILVVMLFSRLLLWLLRKHLNMNMGWFSLWCVGETVLASAFTALYLVLMGHGEDGSFFAYFGRCIAMLGSLFIYPYLILTLAYCLNDAQSGAPAESGDRLKFYDLRHQLRFITSASSVLYIEASENYIIVNYEENGIKKKCQIRNTMKSVEPLCETAGFVRTHRSYIVNPAHIKLIRRSEGGYYFADLGTGDEEGIPVSRKYYDSITSVL